MEVRCTITEPASLFQLSPWEGNYYEYSVKPSVLNVLRFFFLCFRITLGEHRSTVSKRNYYEYSVKPSVLNILRFFFVFKNHLLENTVPLYRRATDKELKLCPGNWKYGSYFTTLIIECTKFLPWSLER